MTLDPDRIGCLIPGCDRIGSSRGVCRSCMIWIMKRVKSGLVSLDDLERKGWLRKAKKQTLGVAAYKRSTA